MLCELSHPLRRTRFSPAFGWLRDGDCYLMDRMQSGSRPYLYDMYKLLEHGSLCAAVLWNCCYDTSHQIDTHTALYCKKSTKTTPLQNLYCFHRKCQIRFPGPTQPSVVCMCHENQIVAAKAMSIKSEWRNTWQGESLKQHVEWIHEEGFAYTVF